MSLLYKELKDTLNMHLTVSREFDFAMAHNLKNHKGACKNLHGHNYKLIITVREGGSFIEGKFVERNTPQKTDSDYGMIIDFKELDRIVKKVIINKYDHAFLMWDNEYTDNDKFNDFINNLSNEDLSALNIIMADYRPTAENMVAQFYKELCEPLGRVGIVIKKIKLYETDDSYAELEID